MCCHVKFGSAVSKAVHINRREPQKLGSAGTLPLCGWGVDDSLEICPSPPMSSCQIWLCGSNGTSVIKQICLKNLIPHIPPFSHSRSLKLTQINPPPVTSYKLSVATFGLLHTISKIIGNFCGKSQIFSTLVIFTLH